MRRISLFLLATLVCGGAYAGTGTVDNREYVNWSSAPYNKIVRITRGGGLCTGQYVAPNLILTAGHCLNMSESWSGRGRIGKSDIEIHLADGRSTMGTIVDYGQNIDYDWGVVLITDSAFYHDGPFDVSGANVLNTTVTNAGFGFMRILADNEINVLRDIWTQTMAENPGIKRSDFMQIFYKASERINQAISQGTISKSLVEPKTLKAHIGCRLKNWASGGGSTLLVESDCDTFNGNSGGPFFRDNTIYGISALGLHTWDNDNNSAATPPKQFFNAIQTLKRKYPVGTTASQVNASTDNTTSGGLHIYGGDDTPPLLRGAERTGYDEDYEDYYSFNLKPYEPYEKGYDFDDLDIKKSPGFVQNGVHTQVTGSHDSQYEKEFDKLCKRAGGVMVHDSRTQNMANGAILGCVDLYSVYLPNPNNAMGKIHTVTVTENTPQVLLDPKNPSLFNAGFKQVYEERCKLMHKKTNFSDSYYDKTSIATMSCGSLIDAAGLTGTTEESDPYGQTEEYWHSVDPTKLTEYQTQGYHMVAEVGIFGSRYETLCEEGGGVYADYVILTEPEPLSTPITVNGTTYYETISAGCCINPDSDWLPNRQNTDGRIHIARFSEHTTPLCMWEEETPDYPMFGIPYGGAWEDACRKLGLTVSSSADGKMLLCGSIDNAVTLDGAERTAFFANNLDGKFSENDTVDYQQVTDDGNTHNPTKTSDYLQGGLHTITTSDSPREYEQACESGGGKPITLISDAAMQTVGCINPFEKWLPNTNNTRGVYSVSVDSNTPRVLLDEKNPKQFNLEYKQIWQDQCFSMGLSTNFEHGQYQLATSTLTCGSVVAASGVTGVVEDIGASDTYYWDNVDPTKLKEYKEDGIHFLIEKGIEAKYSAACKKGGGVYTFRDNIEEPFSIGCINPDGDWLPNKRNTNGRVHTVEFGIDTPYVLKDEDDPTIFDWGYGNYWAEYCEKLGLSASSANGGRMLFCGSVTNVADGQRTMFNMADMQRQAELESKLSADANQIDNMSDKELMQFLGNTAEYQYLLEKYNQYQDALGRENSLANRMLGAIGIGAGGIGGMMIASGIAEQQADKDAQIDMQAYLATFRCDAGTGQQWKGGETNIELPVADLTALKTEYVTLADSIKSLKEQLGMQPGIESDTITDSANMGLYDNVAATPVDGVYTSIANAILDENSSDATEWAEQKEKTETKIKTGTTVGVTGVGGAMIGNMVINRDMYFNTNKNDNTESDDVDTDTSRDVTRRTTRKTTKRK